MPKVTPDFEVWFDVPDDPLNGRILVRHLRSADLARIHNKSTDARVVVKGNDIEQINRQDLAVQMDKIICSSVVGWEKFQDEEGKELACVDENKLSFAREDWFLTFLKECRDTLTEKYKEAKEAKSKNSEALPSGSPAADDKAVKSAELPTNQAT